MYTLLGTPNLIRYKIGYKMHLDKQFMIHRHQQSK